MYHNVVPSSASEGHDEQAITLREANFVSHVRRLKRVFRFVSLDEYLGEWRERGVQPFRKAVLTIDDGTWSTFEYGVRHLIGLNIPSLIFVNSCQIDDGPLIWGAYLNALCFDSQYEIIEVEDSLFPIRTKEERHASRQSLVRLARICSSPQKRVSSWAERYPISEGVLKYYRGLSTTQLLEAGESSLVEIGVHTHTHPFLSTLSRSEQEREIGLNKEILEEKVSQPIKYMAYPSGDYDTHTLELVKEMGFQAACAVKMKEEDSSIIHQLPRVGVYSASVSRLVALALRERCLLQQLRFEK